MRLSLVLPPEEDRRRDMAKQVGVTHDVVHTLEIGNGQTIPTSTTRFSGCATPSGTLDFPCR